MTQRCPDHWDIWWAWVHASNDTAVDADEKADKLLDDLVEHYRTCIQCGMWWQEIRSEIANAAGMVPAEGGGVGQEDR